MIRRYSTPNGVFNVLNTDEAFNRCFSSGKAWESELITTILEYIPTIGTILDIGGHIGTHAIPYSINRPFAKVITFEPQSKIRELLELNKVENNATNLEIMPFGIGHACRSVNLANDFTSDGYDTSIKVDYTGSRPVNFGGIGITNDSKGEKIDICTVDSLNLSNVTYMKIDVEGAETLAVYGAQETIRRCSPVLLIEQSDKNLTSLYLKDCPALQTFSVTDFLISLGYKKRDMGDCNYLYTK